MGRIIAAGIAAGVALFIWGAVEHMMTPIGEMGIAGHPHEAMLLPAIQQTTPQPGLYMFPWLDRSKSPTKEDEQAYIEKFKAGPHGILILGPTGDDPMPPSRLAKELFANVLTAIVAAFVLAELIDQLASGAIVGLVVGLVLTRKRT